MTGPHRDNAVVNVLVGHAGFQSIKASWQRLAEEEGSHFLHYPGWYEAELANRQRGDRICFVTVSEPGGRVCAVLPLEKAVLTKGGLKLPVLQIFYPNEMGVNDILSCVPLSQYYDTMVGLLREHVGYFAFIRWQCIIQDGCAAEHLSLKPDMRITHQSKFIDFSHGPEAFWAAHSSKFRRGLKKKVSKAEESGKLSLLCVTEGQALQNAFLTFLEVEDSGWKGERGTSIRQQPKKLAYYESLLRSYGQAGQVQINVLYLNDVAIAAQFGIRIGERLYLLKIGFNEAHATISPGYLILSKLVEEMASKDIVKSISFVTGVDWIDRWHPCAEAVGIAYTNNGTLHSKVLLRALNRYVRHREQKRALPLSESSGDESD